MLKHKLQEEKKIPKRFEEKWAMHLECEGIIYEAWNYETPMGSSMYILSEKIKKSCMSLVEWTR